MRVLTFTNLYPSAAQPRHGIFVEHRIRQLAASGRASIRVVAPVPWLPFARRWSARHAQLARVARVEDRDGITVHRARFLAIPGLTSWLNPLLMALSAWPIVRRLQREQDFDLIDAHFVFPDGAAALLLGRWLGKPVVVTARGTDINAFPRYAVPRRWIRWVTRHADALVTVSAALRQNWLDLGVVPQRMAVLRNGVDLGLFAAADRDAARAELGFTGPTLLSVGHLIADKGHQLIVDALQLIPDVSAVIVGEGPLHAELVQRARNLGVAARLRLVGNLPQTALARYYVAADATVLASKSEGMPNVLLESLACGTPVIATAVGGNAEVVSAPVAGELISDRSAAAIAAAWSRVRAARVEQQAVRRHAEQFGWAPTVAGLLQLFEQVTRAPASTPHADGRRRHAARTDRMRILHVLDHSLPVQSGYSFRSQAILREQRALGLETAQITGPKHGMRPVPTESVEGFEFHRVNPGSGLLATLPVLNQLDVIRQLRSRLRSVLRATQPDLIHAHSPCLNALAAFGLGKPVVYELRSSWEDAAVSSGTTHEGSLRYRLSRWLETQALLRADHVTVICEGLREEAVRRGVDPRRITVVPNAVDADAFAAPRTLDPQVRRRLGLENACVLGFIGSFFAWEGLPLLIEALPRIVAARPDVRLLLVGGGPDEANVRAAVERLQIGPYVVFAGQVPHVQVAQLYQAVDILVYPRTPMRLTDMVTPLKPLEAMALAKVFIASDVGGHRELVRDRETGVLFRAGDAAALAAAVIEVAGDAGLRQRLTTAGPQYVRQERTWAKVVKRYVPAYNNLVSSAAARGVEVRR